MYTQITKSALSTGDEHIPEWTEESKQKLTDALQYIKARYRQHTDPYILAKLEEVRASRSLWPEQSGVDIEALVEGGFDANSGLFCAGTIPLDKQQNV